MPGKVRGTIPEEPIEEPPFDPGGLLDHRGAALREEEAVLAVQLEERGPLVLEGGEHAGSDGRPADRLDADLVAIVADDEQDVVEPSVQSDRALAEEPGRGH